MDIRALILKKVRLKDQITVSEIKMETGFSRAYIGRFFQDLVDEGKIFRVGRANRTAYVLAEPAAIQKSKVRIQSFSRTFENKNLKEDEILDLIKSESGVFIKLKENISGILEYSLTEMINNAIEHSKSPTIQINVKREGGLVKFEVDDAGIGIFENLIHKRRLQSTEEAIQDLLKGKQTTAPEEHSGEGIFFTRRAADAFIIRSSNKKLIFNNLIDDFTITSIKPIIGTRITFSINDNSKKELRDVFGAYTAESFEFGATEVSIKLYKPGGFGSFVSRSQARRILSGLDKFKKIILNFNGIAAVGQGFVDEIFRVWKKKHPEIKITPINTNEDVEFMIRRSKSF
ncbi:MAG: DUF4325 domain-containing protein [Parcubacteria group bacterium]|nr:DUF4325 domain-containing protein [Parcubacteria group bacterium]